MILVEFDLARLPPEHAVLIKHLANVERCIESGGSVGDDGDEECPFCNHYEYEFHGRGCAWLALQFDRKPEDTMSMVHETALREHARRERQRMPREPARPGATLEQMNNIFREMYGPMVRPMTATEAAIRQQNDMRMGLGDTRIEVNPLVPPGSVLITNLSDFQGIPALRQEPAQLVHGEWPDRPQTDEPVAPPDDEDVP